MGLSGLIVVAFSAFDNVSLPKSEKTHIRRTMVGLREELVQGENKTFVVKTPANLAKDFCNSFKACREGIRLERWRSAIETLSTDPLFQESDMFNLINFDDESWKSLQRRCFHPLVPVTQ